MALRHDRKISVKLLAATRLLRRVETDGVDDVLPAVAEVAADITDEPQFISTYIDIIDGEPAVHAVGIGDDDDIPSSAYAFALSIPAGDGQVTDAEAARAILRAIQDLVDVYGLQGDL